MAEKIQLRRGINSLMPPQSGIPSLDIAEPGWVTDTKMLVIGQGPTAPAKILTDQFTGSFSYNSTATVSFGKIVASSGTAGSPSIYFSADPNTGFWHNSSDTVGITVGGKNIATFTNLGSNVGKVYLYDDVVINGKISLPNGTSTAPSIYFGGDTNTGIYHSTVDGTIGISVNNSTLLKLSNVGTTNTATISGNLVVSGSATFSGGINISNSSISLTTINWVGDPSTYTTYNATTNTLSTVLNGSTVFALQHNPGATTTATISGNLVVTGTLSVPGLGGSSDSDLVHIASLSTTGIAVRTATTGTWATRKITGGSGVTVTNPDGVAGDINISVSSPSTSQLVHSRASNLYLGTVVANKQVFIYDTRLDSDGGTWTNSCQSASWFNEPRSAWRRGSNKFPTVALLVAFTPSGNAGANSTTYPGLGAPTLLIYDLQNTNALGDPTLWMAFTSSCNNNIYGNMVDNVAGANWSSITAKNGMIYLSSSASRTSAGPFIYGSASGASENIGRLQIIDFPGDTAYLYTDSAHWHGQWLSNIGQISNYVNTPFQYASDYSDDVNVSTPVNPGGGIDWNAAIHSSDLKGMGGIAARNQNSHWVDLPNGGSDINWDNHPSFVIPTSTINQVYVKVLPNSAKHPVSRLPIPTIFVAHTLGLTTIHSSGDVYTVNYTGYVADWYGDNINSTYADGVQSVFVDNNLYLYLSLAQASQVYVGFVPFQNQGIANWTVFTIGGYSSEHGSSYYSYTAGARMAPGAITEKGFCNGSVYNNYYANYENLASSLSASIHLNFNTGWVLPVATLVTVCNMATSLTGIAPTVYYASYTGATGTAQMNAWKDANGLNDHSGVSGLAESPAAGSTMTAFSVTAIPNDFSATTDNYLTSANGYLAYLELSDSNLGTSGLTLEDPIRIRLQMGSSLNNNLFSNSRYQLRLVATDNASDTFADVCNVQYNTEAYDWIESFIPTTSTYVTIHSNLTATSTKKAWLALYVESAPTVYKGAIDCGGYLLSNPINSRTPRDVIGTPSHGDTYLISSDVAIFQYGYSAASVANYSSGSSPSPSTAIYGAVNSAASTLALAGVKGSNGVAYTPIQGYLYKSGADVANGGTCAFNLTDNSGGSGYKVRKGDWIYCTGTNSSGDPVFAVIRQITGTANNQTMSVYTSDTVHTNVAVVGNTAWGDLGIDPSNPSANTIPPLGPIFMGGWSWNQFPDAKLNAYKNLNIISTWSNNMLFRITSEPRIGIDNPATGGLYYNVANAPHYIPQLGDYIRVVITPVVSNGVTIQKVYLFLVNTTNNTPCIKGSNSLHGYYIVQQPVIDVQVDATLDPGATPNVGDRYLITNHAALNSHFGTINTTLDGASLALGDNDIVEYYNVSGTLAWRIDFDSSSTVNVKGVVYVNSQAQYLMWDLVGDPTQWNTYDGKPLYPNFGKGSSIYPAKPPDAAGNYATYIGLPGSLKTNDIYQVGQGNPKYVGDFDASATSFDSCTGVYNIVAGEYPQQYDIMVCTTHGTTTAFGTSAAAPAYIDPTITSTTYPAGTPIFCPSAAGTAVGVGDAMLFVGTRWWLIKQSQCFGGDSRYGVLGIPVTNGQFVKFNASAKPQWQVVDINTLDRVIVGETTCQMDQNTPGVPDPVPGYMYRNIGRGGDENIAFTMMGINTSPGDMIVLNGLTQGWERISPAWGAFGFYVGVGNFVVYDATKDVWRISQDKLRYQGRVTASTNLSISTTNTADGAFWHATKAVIINGIACTPNDVVAYNRTTNSLQKLYNVPQTRTYSITDLVIERLKDTSAGYNYYLPNYGQAGGLSVTITGGSYSGNHLQTKPVNKAFDNVLDSSTYLGQCYVTGFNSLSNGPYLQSPRLASQNLINDFMVAFWINVPNKNLCNGSSVFYYGNKDPAYGGTWSDLYTQYTAGLSINLVTVNNLPAVSIQVRESTTIVADTALDTFASYTDWTGQWAFVVACRRDGTLQVWINGNKCTSDLYSYPLPINPAVGYVQIGHSPVTANQLDPSIGMSMMRFCNGNAPSQYQMRKMYLDELTLFSTNSIASLTTSGYLTSSYDPWTDKTTILGTGGNSIAQVSNLVSTNTHFPATNITNNNWATNLRKPQDTTLLKHPITSISACNEMLLVGDSYNVSFYNSDRDVLFSARSFVDRFKDEGYEFYFTTFGATPVQVPVCIIQEGQVLELYANITATDADHQVLGDYYRRALFKRPRHKVVLYNNFTGSEGWTNYGSWNWQQGGGTTGAFYHTSDIGGNTSIVDNSGYAFDRMSHDINLDEGNYLLSFNSEIDQDTNGNLGRIAVQIPGITMTPVNSLVLPYSFGVYSTGVHTNTHSFSCSGSRTVTLSFVADNDQGQVNSGLYYNDPAFDNSTYLNCNIDNVKIETSGSMILGTQITGQDTLMGSINLNPMFSQYMHGAIVSPYPQAAALTLTGLPNTRICWKISLSIRSFSQGL